jgi:hypothetical protein
VLIIDFSSAKYAGLLMVIRYARPPTASKSSTDSNENTQSCEPLETGGKPCGTTVSHILLQKPRAEGSSPSAPARVKADVFGRLLFFKKNKNFV